MHFPLLRPDKGIMFRSVTGVSVVLVIVVGGIGLEGTLPWIWFASFGGTIIVALYGLVWLQIKIGGGYAEITESHLLVKANSGNESYPLKDIADVRLKRTNWGRLPYVELQLRCSLVLGIWTENLGTGIVGVPSLFLRRARVVVEDTEGFAEELRRRLPPAGA